MADSETRPDPQALVKKRVQEMRQSQLVDQYVYRFIAYLADTGYRFEQPDIVKLKRHTQNEVIGIPAVAVCHGLLTKGLLEGVSYMSRKTFFTTPRANSVYALLYSLVTGIHLCSTGMNSWWRQVNYDGMPIGRKLRNMHDQPPPVGVQISHTDVAEKVRAALRTYYPSASGIYNYDQQLLVDDMKHANIRTEKDINNFVSKWNRPVGDLTAPSPDTLQKLYPTFCDVWANSNLRKVLRGEPVTVRNINIRSTAGYQPLPVEVISQSASGNNSFDQPRKQSINQSVDDDSFDADHSSTKAQMDQNSLPKVKLVSKLSSEELEKRRLARQAREDSRMQRESDRIATIRADRQLHNTRPIHDASTSTNLVVDPSAPKPVGTNAFGDPVFADFSMK